MKCYVAWVRDTEKDVMLNGLAKEACKSMRVKLFEVAQLELIFLSMENAFEEIVRIPTH